MAVHDIGYYRMLAQRMRENDQERNDAFDGYDEMFHPDAEIPSELSEDFAAIEWFRWVPDLGPHDAVATGVRVLTTKQPEVHKTPLLDNEPTREAANQHEKNLAWQLKSVNRRRSRSVEADMTESALRYMAVAANVVDLDHQIRLAKEQGQETKSMEMARQFSRWAVNVYNPKHVHVRRSSYGTEAVLLVTERSAVDVVAEYPHMLDRLQSLIDNDMGVIYYDYMDLSVRAIWCEPFSGDTEFDAETGFAMADEGESSFYPIVEPMEHGLPFLPWVAMMGGSSIETSEVARYHPMLYPLWKSGAWMTQNIILSLWVSERIALAGSPRMAEEGPSTDHTVIDNTDPTRLAKVPAQNTLRQLGAPAADTELANLYNMFSGMVERSTVSRILQSGDIPAGTAFSTLSLSTQTAVGALKPAKELAERALAEMFTIMLLWVKFTENSLEAYGMGKRTDSGKQYLIEPDEIEADAIYLEVELKPEIPTDMLQRINGAMMMNQLGYPKEFALEDLDVEDPKTAIRVAMIEQIKQAQLDIEIEKMRLELQTLQMQLEYAQAMQAQQAQGAQQTNAEMLAAAAQQGGLGGNGFNPAAGGLPPELAAPGTMGYEQQTGFTRGGEETGGIG